MDNILCIALATWAILSTVTAIYFAARRRGPADSWASGFRAGADVGARAVERVLEHVRGSDRVHFHDIEVAVRKAKDELWSKKP